MRQPGLIALALLLTGVGCGARSETSRDGQNTNAAVVAKSAEGSQRVRLPAVAGLFYPGEKAALSKAVDGMLASAPEHHIPRLKALVCPHAGYEFSGQTAAIAYKLLAGRDVQTVVVMGPSHYALFQGACIPNADAYQTPLGLVPISEKAKALASVAPFVLEPQCMVQRPGWWRQAPKPAPEEGQDTPETWEHSVEVQVPFLQKVLKNFQILPVVIGESDPAQVAKALASIVDDKTIVVASSDLSHYHTYQTAKGLDDRCVKAICDLDIDAMAGQEACGKQPILTLLHLARQKGWKAQVLDYRNSGDVTGDKDRVVGYTAVAFYAPVPENLSASERKFLLDAGPQDPGERHCRWQLARGGGEGRAAEARGEEGLLRHADQGRSAARLHRPPDGHGTAAPGGGRERPQRRLARPAFPAGEAGRAGQDQDRDQRADRAAAAGVQLARRSAEQTAPQRGRRAAAHRPAHGDVSAAGLGADSRQGQVPGASLAEGGV